MNDTFRSDLELKFPNDINVEYFFKECPILSILPITYDNKHDYGVKDVKSKIDIGSLYAHHYKILESILRGDIIPSTYEGLFQPSLDTNISSKYYVDKKAKTMINLIGCSTERAIFNSFIEKTPSINTIKFFTEKTELHVNFDIVLVNFNDSSFEFGLYDYLMSEDSYFYIEQLNNTSTYNFAVKFYATQHHNNVNNYYVIKNVHEYVDSDSIIEAVQDGILKINGDKRNTYLFCHPKINTLISKNIFEKDINVVTSYNL